MTTRTRGRDTKEIVAEWPQEKIDRFIAAYPVMTNSELMEKFGCRQAVMTYLRKKYHLSKDREFLSKVFSESSKRMIGRYNERRCHGEIVPRAVPRRPERCETWRPVKSVLTI